MTGVAATLPKFQFSNALGLPMSGGTLTSYLAGTTTPVTTYQDEALTSANTNPIELDSRGECVIWLDSTKTYKFELRNALGVVQWTVDNITGAGALADRLRTDLAASGGAALVGYIPAASGATATTVDERLDDIYTHHQNLNNTATKTVYCNPVTGLDTNPGTALLPFRTLQRAIDLCPKTLTFQYVIDLVTAATLPVTYDEDVVIRDIHAPLTDPTDPALIATGLRIVGAGADYLTNPSTNCKIGSITISGCTGIANPELLGARLMRASPYYQSAEYIGIYGTQEAQLYNLSFESLATAIAGVRAFTSGVTIKGINITNIAHAVWAKRLANANVFDWYGTYWSGAGAGAVFRSEESSMVTIGYDASVTGGTAPVGVTNANLLNYNYGMISDVYGVRFARRMYFGNPEYGTTYGADAFGAGENFNISGANAVAIGLNARGDAASAVALGPNADAGATSGTAVGALAVANVANRGTAIGAQSQATGLESVAVGYNAVAAYTDSVALGENAVAQAAGYIRLGGPNAAMVQTAGNYECVTSGGGVFLKSSNGTRYKVAVSDAGAITVTAAP